MAFRSLVLALLVAASALVAATNGDGVAVAQSDEVGNRPNILLIITDDQREGLKVMPKTRARFFDSGTRFTEAYASTPLCCPSRASIFTGRYPHNHGVRRMEESANLDQRTTIQHHLKELGYRNALFGKYLSSWPEDSAPPYFDKWAYFRKSGLGYRNAVWNVDGELQTVEPYATWYIGLRAVEFLEETEGEDPDQPWFLVLSTGAPHAPFEPAPRYADAPVPRFNRTPATKEADRTDKPTYVQEQFAKWWRGKNIRTLQMRTLMSVDDMVGRVFASLDDLDATRETLAFFVSDNGLMWGDHHLTKKAVPYTGAIKVPLMVRWPGRVERGLVDDRFVGNIDIAPTIADAVELDAAHAGLMDGRSLLDQTYERSRFLIEYQRDNSGSTGLGSYYSPTWATLRTHDYQYIENYTDDGSEITFREYYDLGTDPFQLNNLLGDADTTNDPDPIFVQELSSLLRAERRCEGTTGPRPCP